MRFTAQRRAWERVWRYHRQPCPACPRLARRLAEKPLLDQQRLGVDRWRQAVRVHLHLLSPKIRNGWRAYTGSSARCARSWGPVVAIIIATLVPRHPLKGGERVGFGALPGGPSSSRLSRRIGSVSGRV